MEPNEEEILNRPYSIDVGRAFNLGSEILNKNAGGFIGFFLLQIAIGYAIGLAFGGGDLLLSRGRMGDMDALSIVGTVISNLVTTLLSPGTFYVANKIRNREETSFGDFFYAFSNQPLQFILLRLVTLILIIVGCFFLLAPGIYLLVAYMFTTCIQVVYKGDFWQSMELSRKVITKIWGQAFVLGLAIVGINLLGCIPCGLGLIYTIPLSMCIIYAAFHEVFKPGNTIMEDKISGFGQDQKDINTERDEEKI